MGLYALFIIRLFVSIWWVVSMSDEFQEVFVLLRLLIDVMTWIFTVNFLVLPSFLTVTTLSFSAVVVSCRYFLAAYLSVVVLRETSFAALPIFHHHAQQKR